MSNAAFPPTHRTHLRSLLFLVLLSSVLGCDLLTSLDVVSSPASLKVGDAAPPLEVTDWYQGAPLQGLTKGKVHVVEFWATWCGPCLVNIPHMSQLQVKYAQDAIFIGVTNEGPTTVETFLASESTGGAPWNQVVSYRLATDGKRLMYQNYMAAANQMGIPTAFIIDQSGKIAWIGHPADIDQPLASTINSMSE
ncbi:TlpA family protein disulfide reductase [bacterium]|nr:TlpA family protein disulfide reductase [bacterium]